MLQTGLADHGKPASKPSPLLKTVIGGTARVPHLHGMKHPLHQHFSLEACPWRILSSKSHPPTKTENCIRKGLSHQRLPPLR